MLTCQNSFFHSVETSIDKPTEWFDQIKQSSIEAIDIYIHCFLFGENISVQLSSLSKLTRQDNVFKHIKARGNYRLCNLYYQMSIKFLDENEIDESFRSINESRYFCEECYRFSKVLGAKNFDIESVDLEQLKINTDLQICVVDGLKAKREADLIYDKCINYCESINIELAWDAIDMYRIAIRATKNKDIELEAEITSIIGVIYEKVLCIKERAKEYYHISLELAESMKPKLFTDKAWYKRTINAISRYQKEVVDEEEKMKEDEKQKVIEKIQNDLIKIKEKSDGCRKSFLVFIYENYPPKDPAHKLVKEKLDENLKLLFKASLIHYHPDKNIGEKYGMEWYFIADEISKHCGRIYNMLK